MVADHFIDDEAKEFLGKLGIKIGLFRQFAQPCDLACFTVRIGGGKGDLRLVFAHRLRDPEPLGQDMDQRGIDIVDALAEGCEHRIGLMRVLRIMRHGPQN